MDDFDMGLLDDKAYMVSVLRQKMLGIAPVFMYRIKHEKPSGQDYLYVALVSGLRLSYALSFTSADDWNLRKPLQQCSLRIERRGDVLLIVFTFQKTDSKGSALFALCKVDLVGSPHEMEHYVKPVADSSRYFAVRVVDEKDDREAVLGLGFREREEAEDFSQCLINYQNAIARERLNRGMNMAQTQ